MRAHISKNSEMDWLSKSLVSKWLYVFSKEPIVIACSERMPFMMPGKRSLGWMLAAGLSRDGNGLAHPWFDRRPSLIGNP